MDAKKINIHPLNLELRKEKFKERFPEESKKAFEYLRLLSLGEINKGREVTERRQIRILYNLSLVLSQIKNPVDKWTKEDIRNFITRFQNDKILKVNKEPFSESVKVDIKIQLKSYLKWRLPKKYSELTDWISVRLKKKTPDFLTESEITKLYNNTPNIEGKFLISVLFDTGSRIEEFLNIRNEDITPPTQNFPYYKINFKVEYSKTEGRDIGLYWKYSTDTVREYLESLKDKSPKSQVFPKDYDAVRMFLTRLGKRVLGKRVYPHLFRKSSATHYADKLNRQQLCIRYGWKFSSDMVDVYIQRKGIDENTIKESVLNTNLSQIQKENTELKTQLGIIQNEISSQDKRFKRIMEILTKDMSEVEKKIAEKRFIG